MGEAECLKRASKVNLRKELSLLRVIEDYSTKDNALELFLTDYLFDRGDKIRKLDKTITLNNVSMIEAWAMMNGGVDEKFKLLILASFSLHPENHHVNNS